MVKETGLGKGVGVLFTNTDDDELYFECKTKNIIVNQLQPRKSFAEDELADLADSIRIHGILQPLIVRRVIQSDEGPPKYEIIAGERRFRASQRVGLDSVPVVVRDVENENTLLELALIENVQRTDLNSIEEAQAYQSLMD
ncbi:unnamed protein product, partial [Cyprideis torosa]